MSYSDLFRVAPGSRVDLSAIDPGFTHVHADKASARAEIAADRETLRQLQYQLYAEDRRALLVCLQGRDAAGKDGTITHVLGAMNPQGCTVRPFKVPTPEEAAHDFLWRVHKAVPARGEVAIFNRSHYEDVLVQRVHGTVPEKVWSARYRAINDFERLLVDHRTHVLKFYLHIDKDEQLRRFKKRLDDPMRHWKISEADYTEREHWDAYTAAFEDALSNCSTDHAPWFVIPSNRKWFRNLAVGRIVIETLQSLRMSFPPPSVDIDDIRRRYHAAVRAKAGDGAAASGGDRRHGSDRGSGRAQSST